MEIRNWDDITPLFGARTVDNFEIIILYVNYFEFQLTKKEETAKVWSCMPILSSLVVLGRRGQGACSILVNSSEKNRSIVSLLG